MATDPGAGVRGESSAVSEPVRGRGARVWLLLASLAVMLGIVFAMNQGRYGAPAGWILAPFLILGGAWAVRRGFRSSASPAGR